MIARPRPTWGLREGDELAPGRFVLRRLGAGRRCETLLVWDEHRLAVLVAKVLRPDQARVAAARADLEHEAALLGRLAHPVVVRCFGSALDERFPHLVLEHLEGPTLAQLISEHGPAALEQLLALGLHLASMNVRATLRSIRRGGAPMIRFFGLTSRCTTSSPCR